MIDPQKIQALDKGNIFDAIGAQPDQLRRNYADTMRQDIVAEDGVGIANIVLCGMGGSALSANILKNWLYDNLVVPFEIVRGDNIPDYVSPDSLVIISSYSGNTEETLACYREAMGQNARMVVLSAGGELAKLAKQNGQTLLELPAHDQPRLAVFAGLKALACVFEDMRLVATTDLRGQLINTADYLDEIKFAMSPDNDTDNRAMQIAEKVAGKVALVYGGPSLGSAAYKWKINLNENGKQLAFYNTYPELDHNEFQGWLIPAEKSLVSIQLESDLDSDHMKKRMAATTQLLGEFGFNPIIVKAEGKTYIDQLLSTILLGDYVSAYVGILNGVDPSPVELVEKLKGELKK